MSAPDEPISRDFYKRMVEGYLEDSGCKDAILPNGRIRVYHGTSRRNADSILKSGVLGFPFFSAKHADAVKFSRQAGSNPTVLTLTVDPSSLTVVGGYLSARAEGMSRSDDGVWSV